MRVSYAISICCSLEGLVIASGELMASMDSPVFEFRGVAMLPGPPNEADVISAGEGRGGGYTVSAPLVGTDFPAKLGAMPSFLSVDESPGVDALR